jgi:hypothetical protein
MNSGIASSGFGGIDEAGSPTQLLNDCTAVDDECLTGDAGSQLTGEEQRGIGDVMGAGRGQRIDSIDGVLVWRLVLVARAHIAWRDRVSANAVPPQFICEGLDERDHAGLGGMISLAAW